MNRSGAALYSGAGNARDFDPQAMPTFLEKLLDRRRVTRVRRKFNGSTRCRESRLADARNRSNQMRPMVRAMSEKISLSGESAH